MPNSFAKSRLISVPRFPTIRKFPLFIKSLSFGTSVREGTDEDIMSGMFTAATDFIRDSFRDEGGELKMLQYGRMNISLER